MCERDWIERERERESEKEREREREREREGGEGDHAESRQANQAKPRQLVFLLSSFSTEKIKAFSAK